MGQKCCSGDGDGRKDKGGGGGKMVCDKVACERWCVWKMVCERWCVTKLCVWKMVRQSCVWKIVCDKVVWKMVCQRWCERWCVKDGVSKRVCERWCEKWSCDGLWCEKWGVISEVWEVELWWVVMKSGAAPTRAATDQEALCTAPATRKAAAAQRRPRAPQLDQEALCTAPATRKAAAAQRRPRAPQLDQEALFTAPATRKAAATQRRPRAPQLDQDAHCILYCACHTKGSEVGDVVSECKWGVRSGAVMKPATRKAAAVQRRPHAPQLDQEALCTAPATKGSRGPAAPTHATARPGGSVYAACHTTTTAAQRRPRAPQLDQEALCTAPATRKAAAPLGQLDQEALCTAPATRKAAAAQRRPRAPQLDQEALCTAPATRKAAAPLGQLDQEALCTAPATRKAAARPSVAHARRSSTRRLCVLRLPHERQPRRWAAPMRAAAGPGGSVYCACHAKGSRTAPATRKAVCWPRSCDELCCDNMMSEVWEVELWRVVVW